MENLSRLTDAYEMESIIVHLQADIIDELFKLLCMHLSADEVGALEVTEKIHKAANMRRSKHD